MNLKDKTLREIVAHLVSEYNYIFDEIVADIADEVKDILDNEYEENYVTGKELSEDCIDVHLVNYQNVKNKISGEER